MIVQARLGEKICTRSSSSPTGSDWVRYKLTVDLQTYVPVSALAFFHFDFYYSSKFNLAIKDIPEVTHEAKKALAGQLPGIGRSMCVEISLKTSEVNLPLTAPPFVPFLPLSSHRTHDASAL